MIVLVQLPGADNTRLGRIYCSDEICTKLHPRGEIGCHFGPCRNPASNSNVFNERIGGCALEKSPGWQSIAKRMLEVLCARRCGTGSIPCRRRMWPTVWADTQYPRLANAPTIRS